MSAASRIALLFLLLAPSALAEDSLKDDCNTLLLDRTQSIQAFNAEFKTALPDSPAIKRAMLTIQKSILRNRLLKECDKNGGCTADQIAKGVRQAIADTGLPNAVGYGFLIGGMVANAAGSSALMTAVSPELQFMPLFAASILGQVSFISVSLLAPFLEPISSTIRRATFAMTKGSGNHVAPRSSLERQADLINATYTLREQHATDRILTLRNAIRFNFQTAAVAIETGDQKTVVAEIGDAAMMGYRHFRDLSPREPTLVSAIQTSFLRHVERPDDLIAPTLEYLRLHDPDYSAAAEQYYVQALQAWLG